MRELLGTFLVVPPYCSTVGRAWLKIRERLCMKQGQHAQTFRNLCRHFGFYHTLEAGSANAVTPDSGHTIS